MDTSYDDILARRITPDTTVPQHDFLFRWGDRPCFARGELVALTGKAKSGKTIAYKAPKRIYHQSTPAQLNHRTRFALMTKLVSTILNDPAQRAIYEQLQKQRPSTKHLTLRKFIFSILNS